VKTAPRREKSPQLAARAALGARSDQGGLGPGGQSQHCPHRPPCPGCPRFGELRIAPAASAALGALARAHGLPVVPIIAGKTAGFRHRARLAIRGRLGSPKLGLFELGTHRVVHIPNCVVHHPLINRVASTVRRALVDAKITCYSDNAHAGHARYLQVVVERSSQTAQVVLVGNTASSEPFTQLFELLRERLGSELHSLWWNGNTERSNAILGSEFQNIFGPPSVVERFGGSAVHYPPGAFGQNNLEIAERIIEHVRGEIAEGARVAEFYAGVGAIGLSVVDRVSELRCNEVAPSSLLGLDFGLAALSIENRLKIAVAPGPAGSALAIAEHAEIVIADPPRKGLDPELTRYLAARPPVRFVYVSCGLESFLSDTEQLLAPGKLRITALTAFSLLPFTEHVETVARFERA
jgi:23S rRNA (uracil1939-C5)-methyltransferase